MANKRYIDDLKILIQNNKKSWANLLRNPKYRYIYDDMLLNTPLIFANIKISYSTLAWCYLYENPDTMKWPTCKICSKKLDNIHANIQLGFDNTCKNKKCQITYRSEQQKKILFEKYGITNISQRPDVRQKIYETCMTNYGTATANAFGSKRFSNIMQTKYGVENAMQLDSTKEKIKSTVQERYGVDHVFQSDQFKESFKKTSLEKYGVENAGGSKEAIDKIKNTRKKHAEENPNYLNEINAKTRKTSLEKYGVEHYTQSDIVKQHLKESNIKLYGCSSVTIFKSYQMLLRNELYEPLFSLSEYDNAKPDDDLKFKCKKCNEIFLNKRKYGNCVRCYSCFPKLSGHSMSEYAIADYLKTLYINEDLIQNTRKVIYPLELDIYIPSKKLAIEFDGLYWHSDDIGENKNYHLNKTNLCEKQGIQLVHIFENEWMFKSDIVKSRLKNLLGIYDKTVFARKCKIKEIDSKTSKEFQEENHIQGAIGSKINLGLFYENELISLMTFGKCRFSKKYEWELLRFCNKLGYHIPGASGKLLKYFEKNYKPKSLVSYADRRWSQGKLYDALGFKLDHISNPNYWYWRDDYTLQSRVKYQKHKLPALLKKFDASLSEVENMMLNGYHRIFDCGNLVFEKQYI